MPSWGPLDINHLPGRAQWERPQWGRGFLGMAVEQRLSNLSLVCGEAEHGGQNLGQESQRSVALWQLPPSSLGPCVMWRKMGQLQRASGTGMIWKKSA